MSSPYPPPGQPNPFGQEPQFPNPGGYYAGPYGGDAQYGIRPPPASPLAVCSMIGGILSLLFSWLVCCCGLSPLIFVSGLTSVIMGHVALGQIQRSQGTIGGKEMAWVGLGTGYPAVAVSGMMLCFLVFALVAPQVAPAPAGPATPSSPAETALSEVESAILDSDLGPAQGNTPEAVALATRFSLRMKKLRDEFAAANPDSGVTTGDGEFITWCELHEDRCAFIVQVPKYRDYSSQAEDKIEKLAWTTAQEVVQGSVAEGDDLAVATKGVLLWGNIMLGTVTGAGTSETGPRDETLDDELLHSFFEPRENAGPPGAARIKLPDEPAEKEEKQPE